MLVSEPRPIDWPGVTTLRDSASMYRRTLGAVFGLAVVVRLAVLAAFGPKLSVDSQSYLLQGAEILRQGPLSFLGFAAEQSPLYSLLFSVCAAVAGPNAAWAVGVVQAVLGGLTAVLLASFTSRATGDRLAGTLAGLIAAVHVTFVFWSRYVLTDTLLLFLLAGAMWFLLALASSRRPFVDGLITSALLLLLVLTRRTNALASGVLLIVAVALGRKQRLALLGLAVPVALGLAVLASGAMRARTGGGLLDRAGAYAWQAVYMGLQWTEQARATNGVDVHLSEIPDDAERGAFYRDASLGWIRSDPGYFAAQAARKFKVLWLPYLPEDSTAHKLISAVYLLPLYALGVWGWLRSRTNTPFILIATTGVAVFTLVCLVTFVDYDQRYRLPAELFLIPLSAVGLERALAWLGTLSVQRVPRAHRASTG
jgi:4-amino-4-deoxy-L-arabinose transferase-like glycosyltransferase